MLPPMFFMQPSFPYTYTYTHNLLCTKLLWKTKNFIPEKKLKVHYQKCADFIFTPYFSPLCCGNFERINKITKIKGNAQIPTRIYCLKIFVLTPLPTYNLYLFLKLWFPRFKSLNGQTISESILPGKKRRFWSASYGFESLSLPIF